MKGKFPPDLKPLLSQVALKAIVLGEYDENFFNVMPKIFPYNRFTMTVGTFRVCAVERGLTSTCRNLSSAQYGEIIPTCSSSVRTYY